MSIVITSFARTPIGGFQGDLSPLTASELGAAAIRAAVERAGLSPEKVDEVICGNVLSAGQGQAPARQAALGGGLPQGIPATTINKMCGSGLKAVMMGCDALLAGSAQVVVAGGMESMSQAPYLLPRAREGLRMGHAELVDHMFLDGLEDAYQSGCLMGSFAELCADHYPFTRAAQDEFAIQSLTRAREAIEQGKFKAEITPVTVKTRKVEQIIDTDEQPGKANLKKIPELRPAFKKDGSVTAANSSSISDGAAALVLTREDTAKTLGLTPLARICGYTSYAHAPEWFTTAPVGALRKLFERLDWTPDSVDLFEINEAFAVVTMAAMQELNLPPEKTNLHGGACALGHPIGASGARILVTLLAALTQTGGKRGVASLCIGGGEAVALGVERMG